jgi:hypothetical protein
VQDLYYNVVNALVVYATILFSGEIWFFTFPTGTIIGLSCTPEGHAIVNLIMCRPPSKLFQAVVPRCGEGFLVFHSFTPIFCRELYIYIYIVCSNFLIKRLLPRQNIVLLL